MPVSPSALGVLLAGCLTAVLVPADSATADTDEIQVSRDKVVIPVTGGVAEIQPAGLAVSFHARGQRMVASAPAAELSAPGAVTRRGRSAHWSYPERGLTATAKVERGRLEISLSSTVDSTVHWPVTGTDQASTHVAFPRGEGLSIPVGDAWWNSPVAKLVGSEVDMTEGLTMPFWGYSLGQRGISYLVPTDIDTSLRFASTDGKLRTEARHEFSERRATREYTVSLGITDNSPVAAAVDYRRWLADRGELGSLRRKMAANPEIGRLFGAFHAYTWGKARTAAAVQRLRAAGLDRMWLGYDSDPTPMDAAAVTAAKQAGYLVGPYDSYDNAQDPATSDAPSSVWPSPVWPEACVIDANGKPVTGFGGRGCYVSTEALAKDEPTKHYLEQRVRSVTDNGVNSYFLDVDAAGQFFDDYSPQHPMNKPTDRANRLARMRALAQRGLVLGSETAGAWANTALAYSHGSLTPVSDHLWELQKDTQNWGPWFPDHRPGFFFKPVELPADAAKAMFDPAYRVPLYQTVLHDSVISLDRWELPYSKFPALRKNRALLAMLYGTPLNLVLDGSESGSDLAELAELQRFFAPLHTADPMTGFARLSQDGLVQRSTFGTRLTVTANFGDQQAAGVPGGCVRAELAGAQPKTLCP
nr:glycoside hydrolase [Kibdelosporangium sp. MJ126-NF4]CEL23069.1 lipoprotein, putative [Kibdelosporangium sp. MJ126-NF4]CTQ90207.1 lipoprotein, putative [Kibdelosporangium sp. MJ126-NF4]